MRKYRQGPVRVETPFWTCQRPDNKLLNQLAPTSQLIALDLPSNTYRVFNLPETAVGVPLLTDNEAIIITDRKGGLIKLTTEGNLIWHYKPDLDSSSYQGPTQGLNGNLYYVVQQNAAGNILAVSPDGEQIATCDGTDIYLVDWKVGTTTYLTSGCWSAWSPDGNRLAYVLYNDDLIQIRVRDLATNMEEIVYESPSAQKFLGQLVWSPTQDKLAFVQTMESSSRTIYTLCTVDVDGSNYREITDHSQKVYSFTFTPDGNKFLYIDGYSPDSIRMVDLEGQYYRFEFHISGLEEIALSSFGNKIVYQTR